MDSLLSIVIVRAECISRIRRLIAVKSENLRPCCVFECCWAEFLPWAVVSPHDWMKAPQISWRVNPSHRPLWRFSCWRTPLSSLFSKWAGPVGILRFLIFSGFRNLLEYSSRVQTGFCVTGPVSSVFGFYFLFCFSFSFFEFEQIFGIEHFQIWTYSEFDFFEIWTISKLNNFRFEHFRIWTILDLNFFKFEQF
jgi:hypothetical protein